MKLKSHFLMYILPFFIGCKHPATVNGTYIGLEEIYTTNTKGQKVPYTSPENPEAKWFHQSTLTLKSDSASLQQSPVSITGKDTIFSASDGGFYNYSGTVSTQNNQHIIINLTETSCDNCGEIVQKQADGTYKKIPRKKEYEAIVTPQGLTIQGYLFKKE
ncbi:MAG: hypothetical protein EOO91_10250 [Pedobacter sp.]|nr:MAG: hypothetical protein EOO91_10250 [Pedobacter sp.]